MTFTSGPKIPVPQKDMISFLLDPEHDADGVVIPPSTTPFFLSADEPETINYTYTQFRELVLAFASGLARSGFKKGDRLQLLAGGSIYHYIILFGTIAAGGVFTGNTSEVTVREIRTQLEHFQPTVFIVARDVVGNAEEALGGSTADARIFVFDEKLDGGEKEREHEHWSMIFDHEGGKDYQWERLTPEECEDTLAIVNYTSGTTGNPKGVRQTHSTVMSFFALAANFEGAALGKYKDGCWRQNNGEQIGKKVFVLPWHAARPFGQAQSARIKLAAVGVDEQTYVMGRGYTGAADLLSFAEKFNVTTFLAPPKLINDIADLSTRSSPCWDLSSLQNISSSSGPLLPRVAASAESFLRSCGASKNIRIYSNYASTETGGITVAPSSLPSYTTASVGFVVPNVDLKLIDQYDPSIIITETGTPGIIHVRGPSVVPGYYNNPDATAEAWINGWYCTGDVGYFHKENGMLYVIDRVKDVIKAPTGMCIHPAEVEGLLMRIAGIRECGVVGVRDAQTGHEVVTAFVVKEKGYEELTEGKIVETVNKDLAGYKHIQRLVIVEDPLPREKQLGKLLRRQLKDMACVA